jgi:hypothetical protein
LSGVITSALIIALCVAGVHSIVDLRRKQAKAAGVAYMDPARKAALAFAGIVAGVYGALLLIAFAADW